MLDLLDKRNCPVCGGMLKCENSDYTKPFIEKEIFLNVTWQCTNCGAEYTAKLELTPNGYEVQDREANINVEDNFSAEKFMLGRNNFRRQRW